MGSAARAINHRSIPLRKRRPYGPGMISTVGGAGISPKRCNMAEPRWQSPLSSAIVQPLENVIKEMDVNAATRPYPEQSRVASRQPIGIGVSWGDPDYGEHAFSVEASLTLAFPVYIAIGEVMLRPSSRLEGPERSRLRHGAQKNARRRWPQPAYRSKSSRFGSAVAILRLLQADGQQIDNSKHRVRSLPLRLTA